MNFCVALALSLSISVLLFPSCSLPPLPCSHSRVSSVSLSPSFSSLLLIESSLTIPYTLRTRYYQRDLTIVRAIVCRCARGKPTIGANESGEPRWHKALVTHARGMIYAREWHIRTRTLYGEPLHEAPLSARNVDVIIKPTVACKGDLLI